jgi:hypothetical protein
MKIAFSTLGVLANKNLVITNLGTAVSFHDPEKYDTVFDIEKVISEMKGPKYKLPSEYYLFRRVK